MARPQWQGAVDNASRNADLTARPRGGLVSYGAPSDPADRLPPEGRKKLLRLHDLRDELSAVFDRHLEDWNTEREARGRALQRLTDLTDPMAAMRAGLDRTYAPDHPSVIDAQRQLDEAEARFAAVTEKRDTTGEKRGGLLKLIRACEDYLQAHRGDELEAHEAEPPQLEPGETVTDALDRVRRERATLAADLHEVRCAPIPAGDVKARIKAEVEALAERGAPSLSHLVEFGGDIRWPREQIKVRTEYVRALVPSADGEPTDAPLHGHLYIEGVNTFALFAWLHRDALIKKLLAEADAMTDDEAALTDEERAAREAELSAQILAKEREEEALVGKIGDPFLRRPECDVRAFLAIE